MVKGVSVKVVSYSETMPKLLKAIKLDEEIKNHQSIVIKPHVNSDIAKSTSPAFIEQIVRFCLHYRNPGTEIFVAEGSDGEDTLELFEKHGYRKLAERYGIGLVDLNKAESTLIGSNSFASFESIMYPILLKDSFVISAPLLRDDIKLGFIGSLANMVGAYSAKHYKGFFSSKKNKLEVHSAKNLVHDIIECKMPELALIDAPNHGVVLAGKPVDMDKQAAKLLGMEGHSVPYIKAIEETIQIKKAAQELKLKAKQER